MIKQVVKAMAKVAASTVVLGTTMIKKKIRARVIVKPKTLPPSFRYNGGDYYLASMLFAYLDQDMQEILKRHAMWHINGQTKWAEVVEKDFAKNLVAGTEDPWCEWFNYMGKNRDSDALIHVSVYRKVVKERMMADTKRDLKRNL